MCVHYFSLASASSSFSSPSPVSSSFMCNKWKAFLYNSSWSEWASERTGARDAFIFWSNWNRSPQTLLYSNFSHYNLSESKFYGAQINLQCSRANKKKRKNNKPITTFTMKEQKKKKLLNCGKKSTAIVCWIKKKARQK